MTREKGRRIWYVLIMMLVLSISVALSGTQASAATSEEKTIQRALKAYRKLLSKKQVKIFKNGSWYWKTDTKESRVRSATSSKKIEFKLIYLDNDNIPELIVRDFKYSGFALYKYSKGKAVRVGQGFYGNKGGSDPYYYRYKAGLLYVCDGCNDEVIVYHYNGKKLKVKYAWYGEDGEYTYYRAKKMGKRGFLDEPVEISKSVYDREITSYYTSGTGRKCWIATIYSDNYTMYPNTKENRNYYLR